MAKRNEFGKYILSANEIATYVVCPEAWRINNQETNIYKKSEYHIKKSKTSNKIHDSWAENFKDAVFFTRSTIFIIVLMVVTFLFFLIRFTTK